MPLLHDPHVGGRHQGRGETVGGNALSRIDREVDVVGAELLEHPLVRLQDLKAKLRRPFSHRSEDSREHRDRRVVEGRDAKAVLPPFKRLLPRTRMIEGGEDRSNLSRHGPGLGRRHHRKALTFKKGIVKAEPEFRERSLGRRGTHGEVVARSLQRPRGEEVDEEAKRAHVDVLSCLHAGAFE